MERTGKRTRKRTGLHRFERGFLSMAYCIPSHLQTLHTAEVKYKCLNVVTRFQTLARASIKPYT